MTYAQFLAALKKTPREWHLDFRGFIRCEDGRCPIQVVGELSSNDLSWATLGLRSRVALRIIDGADREPGYIKTRRDLLKACGLKERT